MTDRYITFARKYRPVHFDDVVGQQAICRTLKKMIETKKIPQAWLFSGPSGVGKTTCARILARSLNCLGSKEPSVASCGKCDSCQDILSGESLDFLEIDGASNNGVDEIRQLREHVGFLPQRSRFRIILIDEVHMLSTSAFNALLKTLEEPPEHVKFIFATTEPDKIPVTVRARTQRYDFSFVSEEVLSEYLEKIAALESIRLDPDVAKSIALSSGGSVRKVLMILDQLGAAGQVTLEDVQDLSGQVLPQHVSELSQLVWERKSGEAIRLMDSIIKNGIDLSIFIDQWSAFVRQAIEQKVGGFDHDIEIPAHLTVESLVQQGDFLLSLRSDVRDEHVAQTILIISIAKLCGDFSRDQGDAVLESSKAIESKTTTPLQSSQEPPSIRKAVDEKMPLKEPTIKQPPETSESPQETNLVLEDLARHLEADRKITLATSVRNARLTKQGTQYFLNFETQFYFDMVNEQENEVLVREALSSLAGSPVQLKLTLQAAPSAPVRNEDESIPGNLNLEQSNDGLDPKIQKLKQLFKGNLE